LKLWGVNVVEKSGVLRHEIKYYISKMQAMELTQLFRSMMEIDPNGDDTGAYSIRSLYFDTLSNKDYYEKVIGCNVRKKIRLRIYNFSEEIVKLEIKNKYNNYIYKETTNITRKDADRLIKGDSSILLRYNDRVAHKVFAFMHQEIYRPAIIIDYEREAYLYSFQNIRVTIDKNLRTTSNYSCFFHKNVPMIPSFSEQVFVLEIKYDKMLPVFLQKALSHLEAQRSQISKYCIGRNISG